VSTLDTTRVDQLFYPLSVTDHTTSVGSQNQAVFDSTATSGQYTYLQPSGGVYALPADSGTGMGVNGQSIFPVYNNNAQCNRSHGAPRRDTDLAWA
jgi:hypothetical protein